MLQSITFTSLNPGAKLLILGAVHGNEKCGTFAIRRVVKELESGAQNLERGSVTFVPICNPQAFAENVRWIDRNLNRYLIPHAVPKINEEKIGNVLCSMLENCDAVLDLHSYHSGNGSFVYVGVPGSKEHEFAKTLGADAGITGWQDAYAASGGAKKTSDPDESTGTTEYARRFGALAATIECGQHTSPDSEEVAYRAILNALRYWRLCSAPFESSNQQTPSKLIGIKKVFYRGEGGKFIKEWKELDRVVKGEVIATDKNNTPVMVPGDGYIILPHADALPGAEWFYWGQGRE